ncbi:MAG: mycothione reductase [Thermoproteota archaeon]|nr:mycothione reductase [Thermoproteota archaeon]
MRKHLFNFSPILNVVDWVVFDTKEYDLIVVGTGSALTILEAMMRENPGVKAAVIDKDEPGGICLTRGCIPSKILLYPAELVRTIERAREFGIEVEFKKIDFGKVMDRMRSLVNPEIKNIRMGLSHTENLDYYHEIAEFIAPYTLKVGNDTITSKFILLGAGSKPSIPHIKNLNETGYFTSDTILGISRLPESITIIGGGYIAAEYGHFFSAMGSKVTIIGRNPQFLPEEEPEVSALAKRELQRNMTVITNHEVIETEKTFMGKKKLIAIERQSGRQTDVVAEEILVATGRSPNTDILHPERGGVKVDDQGWIQVDEYLETSQKNVWALGDALGRYPFKHKANYEALVVYRNAAMGERMKADYHAVPHSVFTYPEVASVGRREKEVVEKIGRENVVIGVKRYQETAKGEAMGVKDYFVKVILENGSMKILGAHIIGPYASTLIQEVINLMNTPDETALPILEGMHIHPALSEVVEGAFRTLMTIDQYHHLMEEHYQLPTS